MALTKPRLVYFDLKARAEPIRQAYHYGKVSALRSSSPRVSLTMMVDLGRLRGRAPLKGGVP